MPGRWRPPQSPIEQNFELAAARCDDLTPLVHEHLFREHPEAQTMFRKDGSELVPALTIEAILDFADRRSGHFRTIAWCEVSSHDAYARELFIDFLRVIRNTRCAMYWATRGWLPIIVPGKDCLPKSQPLPVFPRRALRCTKAKRLPRLQGG